MTEVNHRARPALLRLARKAADTRYRIDARTAYLLPWFFPVSLVAPATLSLPLAGALTIPRVFLFMTVFATAREFWRKLTSGGYVPIASDFLVVMMAGWMVATLFINMGGKGLVGVGAVTALEFLFGYFMARAFIGTPVGYAQFTRVLRVAIVLVLMTALVDTLSGQNLFARLGWQFSGSPPTEIPELFPMRFGLVRAQGALEHPILLGNFFVLCAILMFFSPFSSIERGTWIAICAFGALLPLSSAPLLSLTMSFGVIWFQRTFNHLPWRMAALVMFVLFTVGGFVLVVDDPLVVLIKNMTFDPQTGLFRVLIWKWAALNIERAPWIGIAFDDWLRSDDMPTSIDCLYLVQAIRYGLPALILLALSLLSTGITMPLRPLRRYPSETIQILRSGLGVCIFVICFNAFTVHFWGSIWVMLAIVLGARAGLTEAVYLSPVARGDLGFAPTQPAGRAPKKRWRENRGALRSPTARPNAERTNAEA